VLAACGSATAAPSSPTQPRGAASDAAASGAPAVPRASANANETAAAAAATPSVTTVDGLTVTTISLGAGAAPIDVASAFGSIWVALHRQGVVSRLDPDTLRETARIPVGAGPGWFAVTDDAVWVNSQLGHGLTRIDPKTNDADVHVGQWATCGAPVIAFGSIWQMACDAQQLMRIDPVHNTVADITAIGYIGVGVAGDDLVAIGTGAMATVDLATNKLVPLGPGPGGVPVAFVDSTAWMADSSAIRRFAIPSGKLLGTIPIGGETTVTLSSDHAWVTEFGVASSEVDASSGAILRIVHLAKPTVARALGDAVWVTSFDTSSVGWFSP
jgi:hypothetical protein